MPIVKPPPPPGIQSPWDFLGMTKQNFYKSELNTLWADGSLTAYQSSKTAPIYYTDIGIVKHWLLIRRGLIALGTLPKNAPLKPDFDIVAWFEDGTNQCQCPRCEGDAVEIDDLTPWPMWCPNCGILNEADIENMQE